MEYQEAEEKILNILDKTPFCVFATANGEGVVAAAQMCMVNDGLKVYIQTDKTFEKVKNIEENPNVAINCGAFYFKGKAKVVGHPSKNDIFIKKMKEKHLSTYNHYTLLPNEVLIEVNLIECRIWGIDSKDEETITVVDLQNKTAKVVVCDKMQ